MESEELRPKDVPFPNVLHRKHTIGQENLEDGIREELDGPGQLFGYLAMDKNSRDIHKLRVPGKQVYAVMQEFVPGALASRGNVGQ